MGRVIIDLHQLVLAHDRDGHFLRDVSDSE
jgi:hypothetical protein